jgi:hypothetical protein
MKKSKMKLPKVSLLLMLFVGILTMSCEKEALEIEETQATKEKVKPVVKPITFTYTYNYHGQTYNEKEWQAVHAGLANPNIAIVGYNEMLYVFDDKHQAKQFELQEIPVLMNQKLPVDDAAVAKAQVIGRKRAKARVELFDNTNYSNLFFTIYIDQEVVKRQTWWGWKYHENHIVDFDLPSVIQNRTTSYRATFIQGGRIDTTGASTSIGYLEMTLEMNANLLDESGPTWKRDLRKNPYFPGGDVDQDGNLGNNRIWGVLGLTHWDNTIESIKVEFDSAG